MTIEDQIVAIQADLAEIKTLIGAIIAPDLSNLVTKSDVAAITALIEQVQAQFAATPTPVAETTPPSDGSTPSGA